MSNSADIPQSRAADINMRAAVWFERYDRGQWNETDKSELDAWLAESPAHRLAYWRVKGAWDHANRLSAIRSQSRTQALTNSRGKRFFFRRFLAGLVVVAVIGAAAAFFLSPNSSDEKYSTALGARKTITLRDGSQIELNTASAIRIIENGQERKALLERGEAYFQIRHDAVHPFVVQVGDHRIVDLGTKFSIREHAGQVEVALVEGRARVEAASTQIPALAATLMPGELAVVGANSIVVTRKSTQAIVDELGWRRGLLVFRRTPLAEAVAEFNRYNSHKVFIADGSVAQFQIGGTFQANNPEVFARVAQDILGLHAENRGDVIVISR